MSPLRYRSDIELTRSQPPMWSGKRVFSVLYRSPFLPTHRTSRRHSTRCIAFQLLAMSAQGQYTGVGTSLTAGLGIVGAFMIALHIARD